MTQWLEKYEQLEKENAALRSKLAKAERKLSDYELESGFSLDKSVKAAIHDLELSGMEMPVATIKRLLKRAEAAEAKAEAMEIGRNVLGDENKALRKKMEGMEEALEPFARVVGNISMADSCPPEDLRLWVKSHTDPSKNIIITYSDCLKARAALQEGE